MKDSQPRCPDRKMLFRADASEKIGSGHVLRCLALAQAFQKRGGKITFLANSLPPSLRQKLHNENIEILLQPRPSGTIQDAAFLKTTAEKGSFDYLIVDVFEPQPGYFAELATGSIPTVIIDDNAAHGPYAGTVLLNPNAQAKNLAYPPSSFPGGRLLGPRNVLLRREIEVLLHDPVPKKENTLLITLGGANIAPMLDLILSAPPLNPGKFSGRLTISVSGTEADTVRRLVSEKGWSHRCHLAVDSPDFVQHLGASSWVISNAGTTFWECVFLGKSCLAIVCAKNQRANALAILSRQPLAPIWLPEKGRESLSENVSLLLQTNGPTFQGEAAGTECVLQEIMEGIGKSQALKSQQKLDNQTVASNPRF